MTIKLESKIFVAGHNGMVGSALVRLLKEYGYHNVITQSRSELDLTNQSSVREFFSSQNIEQVYLAAARVGGINANNIYPAEFIYQNLMIEANVIHESWKAGVKKLLFLGSSCIYPKLANQPMKESVLLTGKLEPTNEPYAIAKIAGIKLCESYNRQYGMDYRSVMPTNLYGIGDNYDLNDSHVIPALIRRFHEAKMAGDDHVQIWGSGKARREFLYVDDMADACLHVMHLNQEKFSGLTQSMQNHINVGKGEDIAILELAKLISKTVGFKGEVIADTSKPDGPLRKFIDSSLIKNLGWQPKIDLEKGLQYAYADFLESINKISDF